MNQENFLFEYRTTGLVTEYICEVKIGYSQKTQKRNCFLLDLKTFRTTSFLDDLNTTYQAYIRQYSKNSIYQGLSVLGDLFYLIIKAENQQYSPILNVLSVRLGDSPYLVLKDTNQGLDVYLLDKFLGKEVSIHYVHTNNQELLQKFLLDESILASETHKKAIKL